MTVLERRIRRQRRQDTWFYTTSGLLALAVLVLFLGVIVALVLGATPALRSFGLAFLTRIEWDPVNDEYGAAMAIVGTLATSFIALLIAVPLAFGIAVCLTELCPAWLKRPLGSAVELLAGVPSIIYGMWGLFVFAPWFADTVQPALAASLGQLPGLGVLFSGPMMGIGILSAGVILAIMIVPFIASVMRDLFAIVPPVLKESAYALGCTRWEVVCQVVLPYTRVGALGGMMLGLGRALGETMAITFVIGNAHRLPGSLFAPGNSIASILANEFAETQSDLHTSALFALGLILFLMSMLVLSLARLLRMAVTKRAEQS